MMEDVERYFTCVWKTEIKSVSAPDIDIMKASLKH